MLGLFCLASYAQTATPIVKKSYKELKGQYNPKEYVSTFSDRYSPGWCGVGSFFIPGLGDAICGEWGRAAIQFFGSGLLAGIASAVVENDNDDLNDISTGAALTATACFAGALALDIWSIIDAVKVSKVKNMYYQDASTKAAVDIKLSPSVACIKTVGGVQPTAGFSLGISF